MSKRLSVKNRGINIQHSVVCVWVDRALESIVTSTNNPGRIPARIAVRYNTIFKRALKGS